MTRPEAVEALRRLASGLAPDAVGVARLRERIAASDEPEALGDALAELGAAALLDEGAS